MKQWNHAFENPEAFEAFVRCEGIDRYETLLVQINAGVVDRRRIETIRQMVVRRLPKALVVGASSARQMMPQGMVEEFCVLAVTAFERSRLDLVEHTFRADETAEYEAVVDRLAAFAGEETRGILLLSNALHYDIEKVIRLTERKLPGIPVFGGVASDREPFDAFVVFSNERLLEEEGLVAVLMHGKSLQVSCNYFFDWEPIGREFRVTKARGRYLYELDGQSIQEVYSRYFGPLDKSELLHLSLAHPLIKQSENFGTVARALVEIDDEKGLYTGEFVEGEKVQIGFGHYERMVSRYQIIPEVYKELPVEALWFYISISYQYGYLDLLEVSARFYEEPEKLFALLTFGEFSHREGKNRFLNYTLTRVALSEDPEARIGIRHLPIQPDPKDELLSTLSTLVSSSTREIMELNRDLEEEVERRTRELESLNEELERRIRSEVQKNREKDKMLYHQSKLASMGEMINNIAHQWRQPLNIIALVMQDLSLKAQIGTLSSESIAYAERKINDTLKYLSDTIDDFRSFASHGEEYSHPGAMQLCQTVRDTVRLVSIVLEDEKIRLKLSLPEQEALIKGSPNDLKQVLLNLVYNAIDVLKERKVEEPTIKIEVKYNRKWANLIVRDNGGGIDSSLLDKIFEPYFTTKYKARGTGLGLYMSKMIVEKRLKGKISARNTRHGAAFWIELPIMA